ncbi:hypothetical protein I552_0656 [Mycobacterium xenopi 3993]|nr:hypothetical protein I552_0656 [Mycobacterium xenopi 3993]
MMTMARYGQGAAGSKMLSTRGFAADRRRRGSASAQQARPWAGKHPRSAGRRGSWRCAGRGARGDHGQVHAGRHGVDDDGSLPGGQRGRAGVK